MLQSTYKRIIELFYQYHGYMSYTQLREHGITSAQICKMEEEGILQRFARGFYWCETCGLERPSDYRYIEIAKVNPQAVICLDSAAYIHGIIKEEPARIRVATTREDRRVMKFIYPVDRHYFKNVGIEGEVQTIRSDFGDYQVYSLERTLCDCLRMKRCLEPGVRMRIEDYYYEHQKIKKRVSEYAKQLRAVKNIHE